MSDKTGVPRPSRGGSGVILTGLAVGALLSTATPAAATPAAEITATQSCAPVKLSAGVSPAITIREQFQGSFTAGALITSTPDAPAIICEPR